jgi:fructose/tagatose bisphosphate aldolase
MADLKYYLGPMSKNVVDSVIDYNNKNGLTFGFIPSRRQVEYDGGYVNNWTSESFSKYVKNKSPNTIIQRDHGGPGQGYDDDDGMRSFTNDAKFFDLIHVDPWKKYKDIEDGVRETVETIKYCLKVNPEIEFEVGTEEAIRKYTIEELNTILDSLRKKLTQAEFKKIKYAVVQSGVGLDLGKMKNTGNFDSDRLKCMVNVVHSYDILTKEHNGDYLLFNEIQKRFQIGLDAINIAPELGQVETCAVLELMKDFEDIIEFFFQICLESKRWEKWVPENYDPHKNKLELIKICGHYIFSKQKYESNLEVFSNISGMEMQSISIKIKNKIAQHLSSLK